MSASVHRLLLRPGRFFLLVGYWLILSRFLARHGDGMTGSTAFLWWGLALPLALGNSLTSLLHEAMHRSFALLLPGARRGFLRSHAAILTVVAVACGSIGYAIDRSLPLVALMCVAASALSLALPFEPGWRWAGSRVAAVAISAGFAAALWYWTSVRNFVVENAWLVACGAAALAVLNFTVAFSPARRRQRANTPWLPQHVAWADSEMTALRRRYEESRGEKLRRRWRRAHVGESLRDWVAAMCHERSANWRGGMPVWTFLLTLGVGEAVYDAGGLNEAFYRDLAAPLSAGRHPLEIYPYFLTLLLFGQRLRTPRIGWLYPISRTRQAAVAYAASFRQVAVNFATVATSAVLVAGVTAVWTGLPFPARPLGELAMLMAAMVPLTPFLQWLLLHHEVRRDGAVMLLAMLVVFTPLFARPILLPAIPWLATPAGIVAVAVSIGLSQWAYYAALRRFYREGDLLQLGTSRRNLSLV